MASSEQDEQAIGEIVRRFTPPLCAILRRYRLETDVDDVLQDVWVLLLENSPTIQQPERIAGWLRTTATREAVRAVHRRRRECAAGERADEVEAPAAGPDELVARRDRDHALWHAIDRLPERDRRLVELLAAEPDLSYDDIGSRLGIYPNSVGQLRTRCLRRLRRLLAAAGITDAGG